MDERAVRQLFPGTRELAYFNSAASCLLAEPVVRAMNEVAVLQCRRGVLSWASQIDRVERARGAMARLIGARPDDVAFTATTADAIGRVAAGLDWRDGDEVVVGDLEYPANVYPWAAQRDRGARLRVVASEDGRLPAESLIAALGPRARVLAVSMVQFSTGYRVDLTALGEACRRRDVLLVVDAIQGLGVFPVDVVSMGIGALATDGRKWLLGPAGSGVLWVDPSWSGGIRPRHAGALSVRRHEDFLQYAKLLDADGQIPLDDLLRPGAGRFETGFYNAIALAGLDEALRLGDAIGRDTILRRVRRLAGRVVERARARGFAVHGPRNQDEASGIVAFSVPGPAERWFEALNAAGFSVSVRDGRLRVSPHVYNTADEVDALFSRIDELGEA